ncbi:MAG: translational GTPase TypA [Eubacterium sp.]|nr:translational GTPase TypA [Eubacterium sp.]
MAEKQKIINIAVIAHVDAGKSTLVDAFLKQSGVFRSDEALDCVMDSDAIERERGITIYSKNCSIMHNDVKINIVDTPGHADFSSEVERIMKTVDTVILLVDSSEGPMPQTRFVLSKSLEQGLNPILLINKIDKKDARIDEVVDEVYELFMDLDANDEQLDFPILYGIARQGICVRDPEEVKDLVLLAPDGGKLGHTPEGFGGFDITPLFETIIEHCSPYPDLRDEPLQMQVSTLAYDDYIGRLGIGRITKGTLKEAQIVGVAKGDGVIEQKKINQVFVYRGLKRTPVKEAECGDIVVVSGIADISIGETITDLEKPDPMEMIHIEEPTLSMNFMVNTSPFAGKVGKYVTSRHIRERLYKELEVNVGLIVEETETTDCFKVSGRGELHLSILIENMRREGYELAVSKPEVIMHRDEQGRKLEPVEEVIVTCPDQYAGTVIAKLNQRKGLMVRMFAENGYQRIEYHVPTRGLLGYRSEFINDTHGEGHMERRFFAFEEHKGFIPDRTNGVAIAIEEGECTPYALFNIGERVQMFVEPGTRVYEGMIVGMNMRSDDMEVNPCKAKKVSNMRAAGSDEAIILSPARHFTLEEALEFIADDELVEVTPDDIRLRKKLLREIERRRADR